MTPMSPTPRRAPLGPCTSARPRAVVAGVAVGLAVAVGAVAVHGVGPEARSAPAGHPAHVGGSPPVAMQQGSGAATSYSPRAVLDRYCVTCHNARLETGGLALDTIDPTRVADAPEIWEKVVRKLRTGLMPPSSRRRPDAETYASMVSYFETALDRAAAAAPNPGRPAVHRLNRAEYTNAIRDLLALEVDGRALLPPDESGFGFDNIGDVLSVSPGLLERYLLAASKISRRAVGDPTLRPATVVYKTSPLLAQNDRGSEDLPFGSRGGLAVRHHFPLDAEYVLKISLRGRARTGQFLEIRLDRERVRLFDLSQREPLELRVPVRAGTRLVGVSFVDALAQSLPVDGRPPPPPITSFAFTLYPNAPAVDSVEVVGPYDGQVPGDTPSRRAIFVCDPDNTDDETPCARAILASLARRAYRRPVNDTEVGALLASYEHGRNEGGNFEDGIRWAVEALLVSPKFLFRVERDSEAVPAGTPYRISDLELASRLSFFLWSSIPDDELLELATRGELHNPDVLDAQLRRMLDEPRSHALVENFTGQWLYLRNLRTVAPDATQFPEFDDNLRTALRRETELFVESQLRDDRGVHDLLRADYTFVNERLARHYGIPNVYGSHFRRVTHTDDRRAGLLGQGSILTVTSYPHRTSPTVRGKWLLENLLGSPPPPPPPDVPGLPEHEGGEKPATMRRADGPAPGEPGLCVVSCEDRPTGVCARELRRCRQMAGQ